MLKQEPSLEKTLSRYAEARALVTGTTAIQGANGKFANIEESLVRNVDRRIFGRHRARSIIDLDRTTAEDIATLRGQIADGSVTALYVHLAEGVDQRSRDEFAALRAAKLLTAATVIIHGTALEPADLDEVAQAGAKLVWSPQSNLRLYGRTTRAGAAMERGIAVGLGADWLPSGSPSLLAELKVARQALIEEGRPATARQLVRMVTVDAARIAGLDDRLGRLAGGSARRRAGPRATPSRSVGSGGAGRPIVRRARRAGRRRRVRAGSLGADPCRRREARRPGPRPDRAPRGVGQDRPRRHQLQRARRRRPRRRASRTCAPSSSPATRRSGRSSPDRSRATVRPSWAIRPLFRATAVV